MELLNQFHKIKVYVGGPYRAKNNWEIEQNVRRAEELSLKVWETKKAVAICPHALCRFYQGYLEDDCWEKGLLAILLVCDALLLVPGWERSQGTLEEIRLAQKMGIPIFETFEDFQSWINNK